MKKSLKELCSNYKALAVMAIYFVIYMMAFGYLEQRNTSYYVIHFGIKDQEEGNKLITFLIAGMTVFLIISAVFPNGHHLRPKTFTRDNIFVDMVKKLYSIDTSTNVLPSIHVYNSIAVMITVWRTKLLKEHKVIQAGLLLLGVSIICSTVLLKQHSMLDVMVAFILAALVYTVCYRDEVVTRPGVARAKAKLKF